MHKNSIKKKLLKIYPFFDNFLVILQKINLNFVFLGSILTLFKEITAPRVFY